MHPITKEMLEGLFLAGIFLLISIIAFAFKTASGKIGASIWLLMALVTVILVFYMGGR